MVLMKLPWSREDEEGEEDQKSAMRLYSHLPRNFDVQRWGRGLLDWLPAKRQQRGSLTARHSGDSMALLDERMRQPGDGLL
jgi:hypothetical protein